MAERAEEIGRGVPEAQIGKLWEHPEAELGERALGGQMPSLAVLIASSYLTSSVLTLVLPLGVLIGVAIWYVVLFNRGMGER